MDFYEAKGKGQNEKRPVVFLVHGEAKGIPNMKDVGQYLSWGRVIASKGIHAITFNHRMISDGYSIEDVIEDIKAVIQHTMIHADELGIDKNRMMIMSFSGGVPFGMYVGMSDLFEGIKGLIAYYGIGDFNYINEVLHMPHTDKIAEQYSLKQIVEKRCKEIPPIFLVRAGLDDPGLNASMDKMILQMLSHNLSLEIINHEKGHHAFDMFDDNDRSYETIKMSIEFMQKKLL